MQQHRLSAAKTKKKKKAWSQISFKYVLIQSLPEAFKAGTPPADRGAPPQRGRGSLRTLQLSPPRWRGLGRGDKRGSLLVK